MRTMTLTALALLASAATAGAQSCGTYQRSYNYNHSYTPTYAPAYSYGAPTYSYSYAPTKKHYAEDYNLQPVRPSVPAGPAGRQPAVLRGGVRRADRQPGAVRPADSDRPAGASPGREVVR
jgi:hypothetical protein